MALTALEIRAAAMGLNDSFLARRSFIIALACGTLPWLSCGQALAGRMPTQAGHRQLALRIQLDGFSGASAADIKAVLRSAANEIWRHCLHTRFDPSGIEIYHHGEYPVTHYERAEDGYIVIGLAVEGRLWARFVYQFSHEFAHALMDHANDASKPWHEPVHANKWLEESVCEMASLFSLHAMALAWSSVPPHANWKSYAPSLTAYVVRHLADPARQLPVDQTFIAWFAAEESGLRQHGTQRDKNTIIARQLLPLFQAEPSGWESLSALTLGSHDVNKSLANYLIEWSANAAAAQRPLINRVAAVFGLRM